MGPHQFDRCGLSQSGGRRRRPLTDAPNTPAATASAAPEVELEFWRSIKDSNKPEELNAYLTNYPSGQFKSLALARIASLQDGPSNVLAT